MLFPLPLAPFESYMLADDRAAYPMVFYLRLSLSGELDGARFEAAMRCAVDRHPLLRSIVREAAGEQCWTLVENPLANFDSRDSDEPIDRDKGRLDLTRQAGLRVWVRRSPPRTTALIEFHHSCCDGVAAVQFVEEVLLAYASTQPGAAGDATPRFRLLDPERLLRRARFGLGLARRLLRLPLAPVGAYGLAEFFWNRPAAVAAEAPDDRAGAISILAPAFHSHTVGSRQLANLRWVARRQGKTVNDLLLRDLLMAIEDWNTRHGRDAGACFRITVPISLRQAADESLPATNVVSMFFIDRRPGRFASPRRLLASVRRDTWLVKRFRLGLVFAFFVPWLNRFRGVRTALMYNDRCMSTAVLSNLGTQFEATDLPRCRGRITAGDAVVEAIDFLPPLRPLTRVALGVITYADQLTMTLHYDGRSLSSVAAAGFLASLVAGVDDTSAGRRDGVPLPPHAERPLTVDDGVEHAGASA
ncbi:MAG: hypothetical protein HYX69_01395 [Planctomycetia bacterium]|nr:hypothetical protein [Planctomycetia bacterium]